MIELFFSLCSDTLFLVVFQNKKPLSIIQKSNRRLHSENFSFYLEQILKENKIFLKDIKKVYFTSNPSGQTGLRVSLAFILALQTLNPKLQIYYINSLLFQVGKEKAISLLTIDNKGSKYHAAVYQNKKCLMESQAINQEQLELLKKQFPNFPIFCDFNQVNLLQNFHYLEKCFQKLKTLSEINY